MAAVTRAGEPLLVARGLSKSFGRGARRKVAVQGVDLDIHRGDIYVLIGLSGSGKSTVLRMLNRLIDPTTGTVELDGQDLSDLTPKQLREVRNRRISMVFQHFALFPHRTVRENAAYGLRLRGVDKARAWDKADEALSIVGLADWGDAKPSELSGGMKQRVGLARALTTDADVILMDEPFSALDPLIRTEMQDLLVKLAHELGRTVVVVTHDLNEATQLGTHITLLAQGRVAQTGTAVDILTSPADDYVRRFVGEVDRARALKASDVLVPTAQWDQAVPEVTVDPGHTLAQVAARLGRSHGAAVTENGSLLGYVSTESVLSAVAHVEGRVA
ncbi:MAG: betaine/proline/choline family ABC transporter ATP-binding protein [Aeromicrobium sp.]|uniref:betaine/proline/choline family ABC transporter ATP-binding protein n=1 Tax=Aeromicrobium sp. TaxID=1871063 RepID=UPI0039E6C45F